LKTYQEKKQRTVTKNEAKEIKSVNFRGSNRKILYFSGTNIISAHTFLLTHKTLFFSPKIIIFMMTTNYECGKKYFILCILVDNDIV
jgi:hypothetical protein